MTSLTVVNCWASMKVRFSTVGTRGFLDRFLPARRFDQRFASQISKWKKIMLKESLWDQGKRFVLLLYDRTSAIVEVNQARKVIYSKKAWSLENIPPKRAAIEQHTVRAVFQRIHLGSSASNAIRYSNALCMRMGKRCYFLETQVDDSSSGKGQLLWVDLLWLQERLQGPLSIPKG